MNFEIKKLFLERFLLESALFITEFTTHFLTRMSENDLVMGDLFIKKVKIKREIFMSILTPEKVREIAVATLGKTIFFPIFSDPLVTLFNFPWDLKFDAINANSNFFQESQKNIACHNLALNGRSYLGRIAQAAALVETQFSLRHLITYGEVLSDRLRQDLLNRIRLEGLPENSIHREERLLEILLYEEPHAVILVDGIQFDPLSTIYPIEIIHPKIQEHEIWSAIASSMLVSVAQLKDSPELKLEILEEAERLSPGLAMIVKNRAEAYLLLKQKAKAIVLLESFLIQKSCARTLFLLWRLTDNRDYYNWLCDEYTPSMVRILQKESGEINQT